MKLPIKDGSYGDAIYDCSSYGPLFGRGHDIAIYVAPGLQSYTRLGSTYSPPSGYSHGDPFSNTFLAGDSSLNPDEVEVFYETT